MAFITEALEGVGSEAVPLMQSDQAVYERLWQIDEAFRLHAKLFLDRISLMNKAVRECDEAGICVLKPALMGDSYNLQELLEELRAIDTLGDKAHEFWKATLIKSVEELLGQFGTSGYSDIFETIKITDPLTKLVDTGMHFHPLAFTTSHFILRRAPWKAFTPDASFRSHPCSAGYIAEPLRTPVS